MYDIIIVGLGPAGAVFARSLDSRFSVLAIDRKKEREGFRKPCGGLLAPDAQKELASLGLNLPKGILVDPQIFSVRTIDLDNSLIRNYQRMYINLDRHKFDMWLIESLPENIERAEGVVTGIEKTDKGYRVTYISEGEEKTACSRFIVGADGAKSAVRRLICPRFKIRKYLSVQQWFREENPVPFYSCVFDSRNTDCYSWTISKDGYFIFGGAYPVKGAREAFERQKQRLSAIGMKLGEPVKTEACQVLRPKGLKSYCTGKDGAFLIGEAAGFISPSSLEGISSAVISGIKLGETFNSASENLNRAYNRRVLSLKIKLSLKNLKCPFMYEPWIRRLVMKSGITAIDVKGGNNLKL